MPPRPFRPFFRLGRIIRVPSTSVIAHVTVTRVSGYSQPDPNGQYQRTGSEEALYVPAWL